MVSQALNALPAGNFALTFYWTAAANGTVTATLASAMPEVAQGMRIFQVETIPGMPAPTNGYSIALKNSFGTDLMAGAMATVSSSANQLWPASSATPPFVGLFSLVITGNLVANAQGTVVVYFGASTLINSNAGSPGPTGPTGPQGPAGSPGGGVVASNFLFSQAPGGTLTGTISANITLTPVPLGVNGTDSGHYLYLTGGTGTAEAVLITGGTAISGASSGTLIFTPANSHSGAWTITNATGGVAEAQQFLITSPGYGIVDVVTACTFHAAVLGASVGSVQFRGVPQFTTVNRASDYPAGDLFNATTTAWTFTYLQFGNGASSSGASIHTAGALRIENIRITDGILGVLLTGQGTIDGLEYIQTDYTHMPTAALEVGGGASNILIQRVNVQASDHANANLVANAIYLNGCDTVTIVNCQLAAGQTGLALDSTTTSVTNIAVSDCIIVDTSNGIFCLGTANQMTDIVIDGVLIQGDNPNSPTGNGSGVGIRLGFGSQPLNGSNFTLRCHITGFYFEGIWIQGGTVSNILLDGCHVWGNNVSNTAGEHGIKVFSTAVSNFVVTDCLIHDNNGFGISFGASGNSGVITGNSFLPANSSGPISLNTGWVGVIADNHGIDDATPSTIASATSIAAPISPNAYVSGTTTITTITAGWKGKILTLIKTDSGSLTIGGGGNIPGTHTVAQNASLTLTFDGTDWY